MRFTRSFKYISYRLTTGCHPTRYLTPILFPLHARTEPDPEQFNQFVDSESHDGDAVEQHGSDSPCAESQAHWLFPVNFSLVTASYSFSVSLTRSVCLWIDTITVTPFAYADRVFPHPSCCGTHLSVASFRCNGLKSMRTEVTREGILDKLNA